MNTLRYWLMLMRSSMAAPGADPRDFMILSVAMFLQNLLFFVLWIVFFSTVHDVKGWHLSDIAVFIGVLNIAVGLAGFFGTGSRWIGYKILSGDLDTLIVRPRHPLPQLLTSMCDPSTPGDAAYGLLLLLAFGHLGFLQLLLALVSSILLAVLVLAVSIMFQSLAFVSKGGAQLGNEAYSALFSVGSVPQHTQGVAFKMILFTVLPAGFITITPVEIVQQDSLLLLLALTGCVAGYMSLAAWVFERGLRRYTSATGWTA